MKKLISLALALVLILSLSTVAFAAEGDTTTDNTVEYTPTNSFDFSQIKKTYNSENSVVVNETLKFTSTPSEDNPDGGKANLTVADLAVTSLNPGTITVTVPSLSLAGEYNWTIRESAGTAAGVNYATDSEIHVVVLVEYDNENAALKIFNTTSYIVKPEEGTKVDTFTNTFTSGKFSVAKNVEGNMADRNEKFDITVTLNAPTGKTIDTPIKVGSQVVEASAWENGVYTTTLSLSHADGATTFDDIPVGVTYTVVESNHETAGYTYKSGEVTTATKITDSSNDAVVVINEKNATVDTGITMDSMPYILLLAVACMGLAVLFTRKRMMREF